MCSAIVPDGYEIGISHPPNSAIVAPSATVPVIERRRLRGVIGPPQPIRRWHVALATTAIGSAAIGARSASSSSLTPPSDKTLSTPWPCLRTSIELVAVAQHDAATVDHDVGGGDVGGDVLAQVLEHLADLFELDPGVDQLLDRLQLQQVAVGVPPAAAAARGVGERRSDQVGARPVVELTVRDPDHLGGLGTAVADLFRELWIDRIDARLNA